MKLLYKYMSDPELFLKDGYIRATQLSALNDPFEATYCKKALYDLCSELDICNSPDELITYIEERKNKIGIISLTEARDNLLMWSHYADDHKGAVIGFWAKSAFNGNMFTHLYELGLNSSSFNRDLEMFLGQCSPVMYRKQPRYRVDKFDFDYSNISGEREDRILFEIFQQKSDEWIYEKEHRVTLRLEQADKIIVNDVHRVKNKHVLEKLLELGSEDSDARYTIYLDKVLEQESRFIYASALAELSDDISSLYLFKVGCLIESITYGIKFKEDKIEDLQKYIEKYQYMKQFKSSISKDFYTLQFE